MSWAHFPDAAKSATAVLTNPAWAQRKTKYSICNPWALKIVTVLKDSSEYQLLEDPNEHIKNRIPNEPAWKLPSISHARQLLISLPSKRNLDRTPGKHQHSQESNSKLKPSNLQLQIGTLRSVAYKTQPPSTELHVFKGASKPPKLLKTNDTFQGVYHLRASKSPVLKKFF